MTIRWLSLITLLAGAYAVPAQTPPQKPVRHLKTFTSTDGTFQFSYPSTFETCTKGNIRQCLHSFIPPCNEDAIVCVVYPTDQFKNSNVDEVAFQVREIPHDLVPLTPDECVTPLPPKTQDKWSLYPEFYISSEHPQELIGGIVFVHGFYGDGATSHGMSVDMYRASHQQKCFELSISQSETEASVTDPPMKKLTPAQQQSLDEGLSRILHSFEFLKRPGE